MSTRRDCLKQILCIGATLAAAPAYGLGAFLQKRRGWAPTSTSGALARANASVFTFGNRMLVYGGSSSGGSSNLTNSMLYYVPSLNTWSTITPTSGTNPAGRDHIFPAQSATQFFVWGGRINNSGSYLISNTGGIFTPDASNGGTWQTTSTTGNCPTAREYAQCTAIDSGRFIVWGGKNGATAYNTGAIYDPGTGLWTTIAAPSNVTITPRYYQAQVWTGSRLLIFGGINGSTYYPDAFSYDPSTDTWTAISTPVGWPNVILTGNVWTGTEWFVYLSGNSASALYNPTTNTWRDGPLVNGPAGNGLACAFWTGTNVVVGSAQCEIGIYSPTSNSWTNLPVATAGTGPTTTITAYAIGYADNRVFMQGGYPSSTVRTANGWTFYRPDF